MSDAAIERRVEGDALSRIVGGGDTRALLEEVERNVKDVIDVARARGFVRKYGEGQHEFYGLPAWQLLGLTYGLVPFVEWSRPIDGGWEARAVVKTREGQEVSAAEAMCLRQEPNRRNAPDHTLRAMAQTRANRNALRSALGAALVLAGFDFADPEGPATKGQVGILHQLERDLGWPHDQAHDVAGVASYKDLTREQASELIDAWTQLRDDLIAKVGDPGSPPVSPPRGPDLRSTSGADAEAIGEASETGDPPGQESAVSGLGKAGAATSDPPGDPHHPEDDDPASPEQWARVPRDIKKVALIKLASKLVTHAKMPGPAPATPTQFTRIQLSRTVAAYLDGERG